jgi:hypothetical protein
MLALRTLASRSSIRSGSGNPKSMRSVMPEFQPVPSAKVSAIKRPGCPDCRQSRMLLSKLEVNASGVGIRTFECQKCGRVQTSAAPRDPLISDMLGWLVSELRPPT